MPVAKLKMDDPLIEQITAPYKKAHLSHVAQIKQAIRDLLFTKKLYELSKIENNEQKPNEPLKAPPRLDWNAVRP